MTQVPNNSDTGAAPADTAIQITKPDEPLVLKAGGERLPDIKRADQLLDDQAAQIPPEIVENMIHQGTKVVLGGSSKAGKSWLLLYLALCVASGRKFFRRVLASARLSKHSPPLAMTAPTLAVVAGSSGLRFAAWEMANSINCLWFMCYMLVWGLCTLASVVL